MPPRRSSWPLAPLLVLAACGGAPQRAPHVDAPLPPPRAAIEPYPDPAAKASPSAPRGLATAAPAVAPPPKSAPVRVVARGEVTCTLFADGEVRCWGNDQFNTITPVFARLGESAIPRPTVVAHLPPAVEVVLGPAFACARLGDGTVRCWGNDDGDLGVGTPLPPGPPPVLEKPMPVLGLGGVVSLTAYRHICALGGDRAVRCWADYDRGNGDPRDAGSRTPVAVPAFAGALQIADGGNLSCARFASHVKCWQDVSPGRIPRGLVRQPPWTVAVPNATAIVAGEYGACALAAAGTVTCWGQTPFADGHNTFSTTPYRVPQWQNVASLALGPDVGCAVTRSGEVACIRADDDTHAAVKVAGLTDVAEVAVGASHVCARTANGRVLCWGANGMGQLGDGTTKDRTAPAEVVW